MLVATFAAGFRVIFATLIIDIFLMLTASADCLFRFRRLMSFRCCRHAMPFSYCAAHAFCAPVAIVFRY